MLADIRKSLHQQSTLLLNIKTKYMSSVKTLEKQLKNAKQAKYEAISIDVLDLNSYIAESEQENRNLQWQLDEMRDIKATCAKLLQDLELTMVAAKQAQTQGRDLSLKFKDRLQSSSDSKEPGKTIMDAHTKENRGVGDLTTHVQALFECCSCHSSRHDPITLNCFHYYCQSCCDLSRRNLEVLISAVTCPECFEVTEFSAMPTNNFLKNSKRVAALRSEDVWCSTCEKEDNEVTAEYWCVDCVESLCAACFARHKKFKKDHLIHEHEQARNMSPRHLTLNVQCASHTLTMEVHCFTCYEPKCRLCSKSCKENSHDLHHLQDAECQKHINSLRANVEAAAKRLGSLSTSLLMKCRVIVDRLNDDRKRCKSMILKHRRLLQESAVASLEKSEADLHRGLERAPHEHSDVFAKDITRRCAAHIETLVFSGVLQLPLFGITSMTSLQRVAAFCGRSCKCLIRIVHQRSKESRSFSINGSLPFTSDIMLRACLGDTKRRRAQSRSPLQFHDEFLKHFNTPGSCFDMALTRNGHVLLAAYVRGLLVYSDRGVWLSSWRPCSWRPKGWRSGLDEEVWCVAALSDGRAAVGLHFSRLVIMLRPVSEAGDSWQEECRVAALQSPPWLLAVHGDLLAVVEMRPHEQRQKRWVDGRQVKLQRLSSTQHLYTQNREYRIARVSLTAMCLVTTSRDPVNHDNGTTPYVVDAFSHWGTFLWRYMTSDNEAVQGICVAAGVWNKLYVAVTRRDGIDLGSNAMAWNLTSRRVKAIGGGAYWRGSREVMSSDRHDLLGSNSSDGTLLRRDIGSSRVMMIDGTDGRDTAEVLNTGRHGLQLPGYLSLASTQQTTALAVLSHYRTVSLYEAVKEVTSSVKMCA